MPGPDVELPADDRALEALLRQLRRGPPHPADNSPWDFLFRWPDPVLRNRVWPILSRFLTDPDELVRVRTLDFIRNWDAGAELTTPRLLAVAEQHPDLYADQQEEGVTLRYSLGFALSNRARIPFGPRIAAALRKMATHEQLSNGTASVLGRYEPAFVAAHAKKMGDAQPTWIEAAARSLAMHRRDDLIAFLQALRGLSHSTRTTILEAVEKYVQRDDQNAALIARDEGLEPPKKPAPTSAECRTALGL